jgi:hypothetical protein
MNYCNNINFIDNLKIRFIKDSVKANHISIDNLDKDLYCDWIILSIIGCCIPLPWAIYKIINNKKKGDLIRIKIWF